MKIVFILALNWWDIHTHKTITWHTTQDYLSRLLSVLPVYVGNHYWSICDS